MYYAEIIDRLESACSGTRISRRPALLGQTLAGQRQVSLVLAHQVTGSTDGRRSQLFSCIGNALDVVKPSEKSLRCRILTAGQSHVSQPCCCIDEAQTTILLQANVQRLLSCGLDHVKAKEHRSANAAKV